MLIEPKELTSNTDLDLYFELYDNIHCTAVSFSYFMNVPSIS